ncbi:galactose oxidase [Aspergillus steynii IBT 23096]|uniref:Galactose oxidase n=1 Tax=Aspergillus steynii IBT 23096 TaxID=1392250 RepID=A0A2I2GEG1_9EURO|nr:galactose oxidase [Aspergillus steynii IBT 23096]PLB51286.1 galactose oxidase [Aspergillus steynii IBT 23096]
MPNGTERGSSVVGVHNEMIYLAGGMTVLQDGYQDAVNIVTTFNTSSRAWQRLPAAGAEIPDSRQHAAGAVIGDIFYVVSGRYFGQEKTRDTVFELDLTSLERGWRTSHARMSVPRGGLCSAAVGDRLYTLGGEGNPRTETEVFDQAEAFDVVSERWELLHSVPVPRHGTQAAASGGRVYIPGGGLQQDGKNVTMNGVAAFHRSTGHFDVYCP